MNESHRYKDRSASISELISKNVVSNNGIFRPVVLVNGQVAGIWKRIQKNERIKVEADLFRVSDNIILAWLEEAVKLYSNFTGLTVNQVFHDTGQK